jgi:putative flippase GtrA
MPALLDIRKRFPESVARVSRHRRAAVLVQFVKFGIVGVSNTLLTFVIYTLLLKVFGVWYLLASAIGFAAGAVNGFLLNRRWTFRGHVGDARTPLRWATVQTCGLGLNEALLYLWVDGIGFDKLLGQAFAIAVVTTTTFLANRAWTFRMHGDAAPVAGAPVGGHVAAGPAADDGA